MSKLLHSIPLIAALRGYRWSDLRADSSAGLITAVMLVPQAMAYAMLAGLSPIVGVYASILPLVAYAVLGSSRELGVGPVAMVSLLAATAVGAIAQQGSADYLAAVILLAGMVGLFQLILGLARLGFLVRFLSDPVISGFTSAAAVIIGLSQLTHLLGVPLPRGQAVHRLLWDALLQVPDVNVPTVLVAVAGVTALLVLRAWMPRLPAGLLVIVAGTALTWGLGLDALGVAVVGQVPAGLPGFSVPKVDLGTVWMLAPSAVTIGLLGFLGSIAVAKSFAVRSGETVGPNRELVALGAANLASAAMGGLPVAGGFSRTAVNAEAGARTPVAGLLTASMVAFALVFLTPLFTFLPKALLASLIVVAVASLFERREALHLLRTKPTDGVLLVGTFAATLLAGFELGVLLGVAASLLVFIWRSAHPRVIRVLVSARPTPRALSVPAGPCRCPVAPPKGHSASSNSTPRSSSA
jgi:SulP family sulfate permease